MRLFYRSGNISRVILPLPRAKTKVEVEERRSFGPSISQEVKAVQPASIMETDPATSFDFGGCRCTRCRSSCRAPSHRRGKPLSTIVLDHFRRDTTDVLQAEHRPQGLANKCFIDNVMLLLFQIRF